jgi:hypothetical protein
METALVPFHDHELLAVYDETVKIAYFAPRHMCELIGLDWASQYKAITEDEILGSEINRCDITTVTGEKETLLLPLKYLYGWLFRFNHAACGKR